MAAAAETIESLNRRMAENPRAFTRVGNLVYEWWADDDRVNRLIEYCKQDVVVEHALEKKLLPLSPSELEVFFLDTVINERGVLVDKPLVDAALRVVEQTAKRLDQEMSQATGGAVTGATQTAKITAFLTDAGLEVDSIDKEAMEDLLKTPNLDPTAKRVLKIRREAAKSSTAKLKAMLGFMCPDGKIRGNLLYHGASTGRWCLAEGTPVLVKGASGAVCEKPIEAVSLDDLVWDGAEWVPHDGVVFSGLKPVITHDGFTATAEHVVYLSDTEKTTLGDAAERGLRLYRSGPAIPYPRYVIPAVWSFGGNESGVKLTFDILNAGPRNRFQAAGVIVSNSGKAVQFQNLPRPVMKKPERAVPALMSMDPEIVEFLHGSPMQVAADIIRSTIVAPPGHDFVCADFAAIEARVLAWLAGQEDLIQLFATGGDPYCYMAGRVYGRTITKDKDPNERQLGKGLVLGCIAEGTPVLTQDGWKPIDRVSIADAVWDGAEWVSHDGLIAKGKKPTIDVCGARMTPDHQVWAGGWWTEAQYLFAWGTQAALRPGGAYTRIETVLDAACAALPPVAERSPRAHSWWSGSTPIRLDWEVRSTFDIVNAGPRNRFTILTDAGPLIVHNCGFGMGAPKFQATVAKPPYFLNLSDEDARNAVNVYREANPKIVEFWKGLENAALRAARADPKHPIKTGYRGIQYIRKGSFLFCRLPSGRVLSYPGVGVEKRETPWGEMKDCVVYYTLNSMTKKWEKVSGYGGRFTENVVQAASSCLLRAAMLRVERAGYPIVLSVHDELLSVVPEGFGSVEEYERLMSATPEWATGCPVGAEGWRGKRYRK